MKFLFHSAEELDKFRFGVHSDAGFSDIWFAKQQKNDVYISARTARGTTRISLHESGICHVKGRTGNGELTLSRWRRRSAPEVGAVHALSVEFPTDFIFRWKQLENLKSREKVCTITAAPAGFSVEYRFLLSRELPSSFETKLSPQEFPVILMTLPSGEFVWVVAVLSKFESSRIPSGPKSVSGFTSDFDADGKIDNVSMIAWTDPQDEKPVWFTNLQGVTLHRKADA